MAEVKLTGEAAEGADEQLCAWLDAYVAALQRGDAAEAQRLRTEHPELGELARCVEALESFAPPPSELPRQTPPPDAVEVSEGRAPGEAGSSLSSAQATVAFDPEGGLAEAGTIELAVARSDFGDYQLIEEIGRGGMGVVYRARQKSLDRVVALKMILANHLASAEQVRRFQAEAKAAAGLSHPNIVSVYEVGQHRGQHYFAMACVDGDSLAARLEQGPFEPETAAEMVCSVAGAVEHLHQHGIIHRDLKPSNILLDAEGRPYVTDFGLAKVFRGDSQRTATGVIAGTPSYMAPEQAAGKPADISPRSDVYSLGAILYELLTGRPPFREENPLDTLIQVLERDPVPPRQFNPAVPRKLELVCLKCLEKSPEKRYPSAAALADDLERLLRDEEIEAREQRGVEWLARFARRRPALAVRLGAMGVFYAVELLNYYGLHSVDARFHWQVTGIVAVWVAVSLLLDRLLKRAEWATAAIFTWAAVDAALLLAVLLVADGVASPMVIGYLLLIPASGLWFRVPLVWFMVALSMACYAVLLVDFYVVSPELHARLDPSPIRHVYFLVALPVLGAITAYQVWRIRSLSRCYEKRRVD